ncbi:universal stress protein [Chloroflexota bacterium]
MYEKIIVPLDGSELATVALPYAEELSSSMGCNITLIYVGVPTDHHSDHIYRSYISQMAQNTKEFAKKYVKKLENYPTINVESKFLFGDPAEEIINYAEKIDAHLIIMATHGQSGLKRWAMGSTANKVIRASRQPVWLIRGKRDNSDMREKGILGKALVPLDGSKESEAVIPFIVELASKLKAEIVLLHVLSLGHHAMAICGEGYEYFYFNEQQLASDKTTANRYLEKVVTQLKQRGVSAKSQVKFGNVAEEIIQVAADMQADVIAMSTHGRSGIGRWIFGSVAEKILYEGNTPLLLVRSSGANIEFSNQYQDGSKKRLPLSLSVF